MAAEQDPLEVDPRAIADPVERARLIFTQWHIDEAVTGQEAEVYAASLLARLAEYGLTVTFRHVPRQRPVG